MRWLASFTLSAIFVLAAVGGTAYAAGWQPVVNVSAGTNNSSFARVAVDGDGDAVAVWARYIGLNSWEVVASSRPRGGDWGAPVPLTDGHRTVHLQPKIAVDPEGNAVALWVARPPQDTSENGTFNSIWASSRTQDGAWSDPVEIAVASAARDYDVTIDENGQATAVWYSQNVDEEGEPGYFVRASSRPLGGEWSDQTTLSIGSAVEPDLDVAVNEAGDVALLWNLVEPGVYDPETETTIPGGRFIQAAIKPAGGEWGGTENLTDGEGIPRDPTVAIDDEGNVTALWTYEDSSEDITIQTAYRDAESGEWSDPELFWDDPADVVTPALDMAAGPEGEITALWSSYTGAGHTIRSSSSVEGATWSEPEVVAGPTSGSSFTATNPRLVSDPEGNLTATWVAGGGTKPTAVHRAAGEYWGEPEELSGADEIWAVELAADPQGYVTAIWSGQTAVHSRVFDPVAPELTEIEVPENGIVGETIEMSVSAFDVWSSVTIGWDFGEGEDGATATGAEVSHCFSAPGDYTVTITGSDLAGNTSTETRSIEIAADPDHDPEADSDGDPCTPEPDPNPGQGSDPGEGPDPQQPGGNGPGESPKPSGDGTREKAAPVIKNLRLTKTRWRLPRSATAGRSARRSLGKRAQKSRLRVPVGTVIRVRLSRTAQVKLRFVKLLPGGKTRQSGELRLNGAAGINTVPYRGKVKGRWLSPGRYRLIATAHANGKKSSARTATFTILP